MLMKLTYVWESDGTECIKILPEMGIYSSEQQVNNGIPDQ